MSANFWLMYPMLFRIVFTLGRDVGGRARRRALPTAQQAAQDRISVRLSRAVGPRPVDLPDGTSRLTSSRAVKAPNVPVWSTRSARRMARSCERSATDGGGDPGAQHVARVWIRIREATPDRRARSAVCKFRGVNSPRFDRLTLPPNASPGTSRRRSAPPFPGRMCRAASRVRRCGRSWVGSSSRAAGASARMSPRRSRIDSTRAARGARTISSPSTTSTC